MKSGLSKSTNASRAETDINRIIKSFSLGTCNKKISRFLLFEICALNLSNLVKLISRDESLFASNRFQNAGKILSYAGLKILQIFLIAENETKILIRNGSNIIVIA